MPKTLNVLFLAAEAEPFVKVGGLGDVAGALPRALRAIPPRALDGVRLDVRLIIPFHASLRVDARPLVSFGLWRGGIELPVQVFETRSGDVPVYLIGGEPVTATGSVYSLDSARDAEKYTFFSLAALELIRHLNWKPDILHVNDWHTALAAHALAARRGEDFYARISSLLTLHNLPFMGPDLGALLPAYGLAPALSDLPEWARALPLPLGLLAVDAIVAVSPTYAREILTPEHGCGLHEFLRGRAQALRGILNGIDVQTFDPQRDPLIAAPFNARSLRARLANKSALQGMLGLPPDADFALLGLVARFDPQKGIDLAIEALRRNRRLNWQAVLLGTGQPDLEEAARKLQQEFPGRVRAEIRFDTRLSRMIYAGADLLLMPSRYEPCGLSQMMAMRYGCVPLVRAVGGLNDTVVDGVNGFVFREATPEALDAALERALDLYPDRPRWQALQRSGMTADFSWNRSAREYAALYLQLKERTR